MFLSLRNIEKFTNSDFTRCLQDRTWQEAGNVTLSKLALMAQKMLLTTVDIKQT